MHAIYENHYLSDHDVANFARQSFGKLAESFTSEQNHQLIRFLARGMSSGDWEKLIQEMWLLRDDDHAKALAVYLRSIPEHWVPFAHPHITLRMSAPVPIARQLFKHKQGLVESEESRRYIKSRPELYVPDQFRSAPEGSIKQGSGGMHCHSDYWRTRYLDHCSEGIELYLKMVQDGVCPEQARFALPQGTEVNWVWTGSLYAFANFFTQRANSHAQQESQHLAHAAGQIIEKLFPVSWAALTQGAY